MNPVLAVFAPGPMEICVVVMVMVVLFGPKQVPKLAKAVGSIIPSFRSGMKEVSELKSEFKGGVAEVVGEVNGVAAEMKKTVS